MAQRVLIVEDEALIALDLSFCLEDLGYEVLAMAADSSEALAVAGDGVDLAFVDVNLRDGATGPELGQVLAHDHGATVIYLTANPCQVSSRTGGPVGVLPKPFTEAALVQTVRFASSLRAGRPALPPAGLRLLPGAVSAVERVGGQARL